jgi:hypothetical protein
MTVPECGDYKIIIVDTDNVIYNGGNSNIYSFHLNLIEPLKDAYKIKLLYDAISLPTSNLNGQGTTIKNLDSIFINCNDYDRVRTTIGNNNNIAYFDSIMIDLNKIKNNTGTDKTTMYNDFNENEGDYYLNPIASQFKRIDIQLLDKNNNILTKNNIDRFVMKLCIYYNNKKISQF